MRRIYDGSLAQALALGSFIAVVTAASAAAQSAPPLTPFRGLIDMVSARPNNPMPTGSDDLSLHTISADGRYVVFSSWSPDLVPGETSPWENVFIRDRMTGQTQRVSRSNSGMEGDGLSEQAATITAPGTVTGTVEFYDGSALIGTAPVSGTTARLTTAALALGGHPVTAKYLGNGTIPPSVSPALAQYVKQSGTNPRTSTVSLVASPSPASLGSTVTLTATVTGSNNRPPSGLVTFMLNGTVLAQGAVTTIGSNAAAAVLNAAGLAHGTHKIEAVYLGDSTYKASTTSITLVVN